MAKELRFNDPDYKHTKTFALEELLESPKPGDKLEVHIAWESGTYGARMPVVVIKVAT